MASTFKRILNVVALAFVVFWIAFILLEFWTFHEDVVESLRIFTYGRLTITLLILGAAGIGGIIYLCKRKPVGRSGEHQFKWLNGLTITGLSLVLMVIMMNGFFSKTYSTGLDGGQIGAFVWTIGSAMVAVFLVVMVCYVTGAWLIDLISLRMSVPDLEILKVALGMIGVVTGIFLLGTIHALKTFVLWPLLVAILVVGWRYSLHFLRMTLWRPFRLTKQLDVIGMACFFLLVVLVCMNLITTVRPMALGYDAMTLYVNLASLVNDYDGLVQGNAPYNWSIFMSMGYLLFNSTEVAMTLCFSGYILSLFALYRLTRKWLDENLSLLCLLLFSALPLINWLSFKDMKVDMGLLFFSLTTLLVFYAWIHPFVAPKVKKKKARSGKGRNVKKSSGSQPNASRQAGINLVPKLTMRLREIIKPRIPAILAENKFPILIGILIGFGLGIKLSALILFFPIIAAIWYKAGGLRGFMAATALTIFFILIGRIDDQAGLRQFHLGVGWFQFVTLGLGLGLCGWWWLSKKNQVIRSLKFSLIIGCFMALTLSPWLIKNYSESGSLSVRGLTAGQTASPRINMNEMDRIWKGDR